MLARKSATKSAWSQGRGGMRLTCPNCGAQYEVPDQVIPKDGRDVQCSNCGNTWFFAHPDFSDAKQETPGTEADALRDAVRDLGQPSDPDRSVQPDQPASPKQPSPPEAARRNLDPNIKDILREEARHEAELREAEARSALESQPDLGLDNAGDDPELRARQARERMARMRGEPVASPAPRLPVSTERDPRPTSRKEMLPDIEEISSSLRQSETSEGRVTLGTRNGRGKGGGFKRGFAVAIIIVVALSLIYANAPMVAEKLPEADPMLSAFVALVDEGRLWLHQAINP